MMDKDSSVKDEKNTNADTVAEENTVSETKHRRRLQDGIKSKTPTRKMNLDRRVQSDRRSRHDTNYKGPSRRYTIDRRLNIKDRRKSDD